jgi:hypothetical protein
MSAPERRNNGQQRVAKQPMCLCCACGRHFGFLLLFAVCKAHTIFRFFSGGGLIPMAQVFQPPFFFFL